MEGGEKVLVRVKVHISAEKKIVRYFDETLDEQIEAAMNEVTRLIGLKQDGNIIDTRFRAFESIAGVKVRYINEKDHKLIEIPLKPNETLNDLNEKVALVVGKLREGDFGEIKVLCVEGVEKIGIAGLDSKC